MNAIVYAPNDAIVPNRIVKLLDSRPPGDAEAAVAAGYAYLEVATLEGLPQPIREHKVSGGQVVAFDAADLAAIAAANAAAAAAQLAALKAEAKERLVLQNDFREAFEAFAEIVVSEINILRSQHGLAARTPAQVKTAFKAAYDGKIDLWT